MINDPPDLRNSVNEDLIPELIQRLISAQADLRAALPEEIDAIIDPVTASPILLRDAQQALQESETRYRRLAEESRRQADKLDTIFLAMADPVTVYDAAGVSVQANPAMVAMLGFNPLGMRATDIYDRVLVSHPDWHAVATDDLPTAQALRGKVVVGQPLIISNAIDGHKRSILASSAPLFEQDKVSGVVIIWHDVTERELAEQALRQRDSLLEVVAAEAQRRTDELNAIFAAMTNPVTIYSADGVLVDANPAARESLGMNPVDTLVFQVAKTVQTRHPDGRLALRDELPTVRALRGEVVVSEPFVITNTHGRESAILASASPLYESGKISGAVVVWYDISEREQAARALEESAQFNRAVLNSLASHITVLDNAGTIIAVNETWEQFARDNGDPTLASTGIGTNYLTVCQRSAASGNEDAEQARIGIRAVMNGSLSLYRFDYACHSPNETRWFAMRVTPMSGPAGGVVISHSNITERKKADDQIHFQAHLLDTIGQAVIATNLQGNIIYWNHFAELLYGWSAAEAVGCEITELVVSVTTREHAKEIMALLRKGESYTGEFVAKRRNETTFPAVVTDSPIFDASGALVGIIGVSTDITERKLAEQAIYQAQAAEREQRIFAEALRSVTLTYLNTTDRDVVLNSILDNVGRVVAHDASNIMLLQNEMLTIVQWSGQTPAQTIFDLRPISLKDVPSFQRVLFTGEAFLVTDTRLYPDWVDLDGDSRVRSYVGTPIRVHGQIIGFLNLDSATPGFFTAAHAERLQAFADEAAIAIENAQLYEQLQRHATELEERVEQRTQELRAVKERSESILNNSSDAILLLDSEGSIQQSNPAFNTLFGYGTDEVFNQSLTLFVEPDKAETIKETLHFIIQSRKPARIELVARRKDASTFSADIALAITQEHNTVASGIICNVRDNTPQKRLEQELRGALEQEKELGELKSRFVSMASHEFRTPLATILAASETLSAYRHKMTEEQIEKRFGSIRNQVEHLRDIMDDVLQLARMQSGRTKFNLETFTLDTLCRDILDEFSANPHVNHQLQYTCLSSALKVRLDKTLMREIISNLVSNAIKYSPANRPVTIHVEHSSEVIVLSVSDQGIGISESDQKHLFEPFHRGDNVGTISGSGLGLVITKESVELQGGTITVDSKIDVGTTFTVRIPVTIEGGSNHDENPGN